MFGKSGALQESTGLIESRKGAVQSGGKCLGISATPLGGTGVIQLWAKPQPNNAVAILVINTAPGTNVTMDIPLSDVNITASSVNVRDIWDKTTMGAATGSVKVTVNAMDSVFQLWTPSSD